ncbi:MAG: hypothetical protein WA113_01015 [Desulfitobacteriaceae bacterium]
MSQPKAQQGVRPPHSTVEVRESGWREGGGNNCTVQRKVIPDRS